MLPPPDIATVARYIAEAEKSLGVPIDPAWRAAVAEHYRRLLEASEVIESCGVDLAASEPAMKFEP